MFNKVTYIVLDWQVRWNKEDYWR